MKLVKTILGTLLVLVALVLAASLFMPSTFSVKRSRVIPMAADSLYARFVTPRTWARWSAWTIESDPTLVYRYPGPDSGLGAVMEWTAKKLGDGRLTIVEAKPGREVDYDLRLATGGAIHGRVTLEPSGAGTLVTWNDSGDVGKNPIYRLMLPLMDGMLGAAYEKAFANLTREAGAK